MLKFIAASAFTTPDNGQSRREGQLSDGRVAAEVRFEAGAFGQLKKRADAVHIRVIDGDFEFTVGSDILLLQAGESVAVPAQVPSGCFCLSAGTLLEIGA
ncbi:cupin domain-containing protein [Serratia rhizosphaerae]|uniref:cupin n=1 Tax=Serratia rhizosphaerae TaxID=2597702 RepID=UPI002DBBB74E|nr:cupin [Serratia rhizosphaerae]MEB6336770.1 cupin [Serratia rhizosphaerae]